MGWIRFAVGAAALGALGASLVGVTTSCQSACSCMSPTMWIQAPDADLVSATGCGQTASCDPPCSALQLLPPPDGGDCTVVVTFADGTQASVQANWGAVHPSDGCCGPWYDSLPYVIFDAGSAALPDSGSDAGSDADSDTGSDSASDSASD